MDDILSFDLSDNLPLPRRLDFRINPRYRSAMSSDPVRASHVVETGAVLAAPVASTGPSTTAVSASGQSVTISVPFSMIFTATTAARNLDIRGIGELMELFTPFESVLLLDVNLTIRLLPHTGMQFSWSVSEGGDRAASFTRILTGQFAGFEASDGDQVTTTLWSLPQPHGFAREIKMNSLGNQRPIFHFRMDDGPDAGNGVVVTGNFVFRAIGNGIIPVLSL